MTRNAEDDRCHGRSVLNSSDVTWQRGTAWASEFTVKVVAATVPNFTAMACLRLVPGTYRTGCGREALDRGHNFERATVPNVPVARQVPCHTGNYVGQPTKAWWALETYYCRF